MKQCQIYACILLVAVSKFSSSTAQEQAFRNVLENAMKEYPAWIKAKGLDPTPRSQVVLDLFQSMPGIEGEITNQELLGHSNITKTTISSNLYLGYFVVHTESEFIVRSDFFVNGTAPVGAGVYVPVEGSGSFSVNNVGAVLHTEVSFAYIKLVDGYIDLSKANILCTQPTNVWGIKTEFSGLTAGGYEDIVNEALRDRYKQELRTWLPIREFLTEYFTEVFETTPITTP